MPGEFDLSLYDFHLPKELIAQYPKEKRDESRLLVYDRKDNNIYHTIFREIINYLNSGDCLVINNTKVFPARFITKKETGGRVEIFLLNYPQRIDEFKSQTVCLINSSKRAKEGSHLRISDELYFEILRKDERGHFSVLMHHLIPLEEVLIKYGKMPLPPYIERDAEEKDFKSYQTEYAKITGSVAAPTAGLHFTHELLQKIREKGIKIAEITLHVGIGTFQPVRSDDIREHKIHPEWLEIGEEACKTIKDTKKSGNRVIATGTTTVRTLEYVGMLSGDDTLRPFSGFCDLYIYPGFKFKVIDALITNFHLPRSSLLILVSAFIGREKTLEIYREAVSKEYRFYSYGDAMLIL